MIDSDEIIIVFSIKNLKQMKRLKLEHINKFNNNHIEFSICRHWNTLAVPKKLFLSYDSRITNRTNLT
jgi:hypothetical protein